MSQTYYGQILDQVNSVTENCGPVLLFGENIDNGSRISGLARGLNVNPAGRILNVGNCELTHIGVGLGMMMDGGNAVVFMKQLDFLLLGLDQMVNTFNFVRTARPVDSLGSFTIFVIVCDQGYQGPHSSMNSAGDFASLANINAYCLNGSDDAAHVVRGQFVTPGFRMVCVSQRLFGAPSLDIPMEGQGVDNAWFKYRSGSDVTLVCHNFALRDGVELAERMSGTGIQSDLFHVNYVPGMDLEPLIESCERSGSLVLLDDSKTVTKFGDALVTELRSRGLSVDVLSLGRRGCNDEDYGASEDRFVPDYDTVRAFASGS